VARLEDFKTATKAYVADYRTLVSPGQKSFSETYGVITGARPRRPTRPSSAQRPAASVVRSPPPSASSAGAVTYVILQSHFLLSLLYH